MGPRIKLLEMLERQIIGIIKPESRKFGSQQDSHGTKGAIGYPCYQLILEEAGLQVKIHLKRNIPDLSN